jgi:hypothetical protein
MRIGVDFSAIRVHDDERAATSAHGVGAATWTVGETWRSRRALRMTWAIEEIWKLLQAARILREGY